MIWVQLFDTQYVIDKSNIENYLQTKKQQHETSSSMQIVKYFQRAFDVFWQLICSEMWYKRKWTFDHDCTDLLKLFQFGKLGL